MEVALKEIPITTHNPEAKYTHEGRHVHPSKLPLINLPTIDLSQLTATDEEADRRLLSALSTYSCMMITNHGVESWLLEKVATAFKQFVALPEEEKLKWKRQVDGFEGFGTDPGDDHDLLVRDWSVRLRLTVLPMELRQLKYWPESPPQFREVLEEYSGKVVAINEVILKSLARSLNLKETAFLSRIGEPSRLLSARFNFYPPCPRPDLVYGLKPHNDSTLLTVLLQDKEVEGLQVEKDGQWFRVPVVPGALVINVGEQLEILSNGEVKSLNHRATVDSERERVSVAMLSFVNPEVGVEPVEGMVGEERERPALYRKVKFDHGTHFDYYRSGKRVIDDARI